MAATDETGARSTSPKIVLTGEHRLVLLAGMSHVIKTIFDRIDAARERVWVETYIVRHDKLGRALASRLARAQARGVDVRLLYDAVGSQHTRREFFEELRRHQVQVRCYRPPGFLYLGRGRVPRDHSRNVVIDATAFTGGSAWGDEWLPCDQGGCGWHDVCMQIDGPAVLDMVDMFDVRWEEALRPDLPPSDHTTNGRYPELEIVADSPSGKRLLYERHLERIRSARHRVWIENSYFFGPPALMNELEKAVRRGVDVRLLLPSETDLHNVQWAARGEYVDWMRRGIKVHEYTRTVMHSKFAVIDDDWATIGTFNINSISLHWVNELNVFIHDRRFVASVAALFERDLHDSRQMDEAAVAALPAWQRARSFAVSRAYRVAERMAEALAPSGALTAPSSEREQAEAEAEVAPVRLLVQAVGGFAALFVGISALAYTAREPLQRMGHSFVERFGLVGMATGTLLADGLHFPVPPQFYLLAAITGGGSDIPAIVAVCVGSVLGGLIAFHVGRWLADIPFLQRRVAHTRPRVDALFHRYGAWALAVASATPIPYSFFCYLLGAYRTRYRELALLSLFRIPRILVFYLLLRLGWSFG